MDWMTVLQVSASKGPRILFQMSLFAVFFYFFGLPAVDKYKDYDVIVVEKTKFTKGIPLPAITIVVSDQLFGFDYDSCYNMSASAIDECINANSKNWSHIIKGVTQGFVRKKSLSITSNQVKEDFNRLFGRSSAGSKATKSIEKQSKSTEKQRKSTKQQRKHEEN